MGSYTLDVTDELILSLIIKSGHVKQSERQLRDRADIIDPSAKDVEWLPPLTLFLLLTPALKTLRGVPLDDEAC